MENASISSRPNTAQLAATTLNAQSKARMRQTEQDKQAQQPQQFQKTQQNEAANQARKIQSVVENTAVSNTQPESAKSRSSVNANGQTVGTRVNTIA